jgi:hypothetical protein
MRSGLSYGVFVGGAVKADVVGAIRPKAYPTQSQGVLWAGRDNFSGEGMLPSGFLNFLDDLILTCGGFPTFSTDSNGITGEELLLTINVNSAIAQFDH